ncbi:MAG: ATP-binding protein [Gemmatimonadaceae bacterium]
MRLAQRLLVGALLIVTVLVALLVWLSGERLRTQLTENAIDRLTHDARFIASQWTGPAVVDPDELADIAGATLGHRVTLIDSAGNVVGDSEFDGAALTRLENHASRPEVVSARSGQVGVATRVSTSAGDEEFYVAVPAANGVSRVSYGTGELQRIVNRARTDVMVSGLVALVVALILAYAFSRSVSEPIAELRDVARDLAAGDLSRRPTLSASGEVGDLAAAIHSMAAQLDSRLRLLEAEDMLLAALIESLHEGVVAVDAQYQVVRINENGRRLLGVREPVPFSAHLLPRERSLREALAAALAGTTTARLEIVVGDRTLALTARPHGDEGAVLALFDLTEVRRLETVRRDFVANVSHELKTPLTVIGGFAETLVTDDMPPVQRRKFAEAIQASAHRMHRLVDDLLDLSRIESGGWRPRPSPVDMLAVASDVASAFQARATEKGVKLAVEVDAGMPRLMVDPTALRQIVENLIDNAIRHTPAEGAVTVYASSMVDGVRVGVRDTGTGIDAEHVSRIFERFYRADPARSREAGGTGLGLAIVRHLAEAHGARAHAESTLGRGTTVEILFPTETSAAS